MSERRRQEILLRIQRSGYASARRLAEEFGVDVSTIRRDLDAMARLGMVVRSHGGASLPLEPAETPYAVKVEKNVLQKRAIGRAVAAMIEHNSTLLVDSGSTTLEVARALRQHRGMTVVTNDLRVAAEIANQGDVRLIVIGGEVLPSVYTLMSERAVELIEDYHVDIAILGADAIDPRGVTNTNSSEASMKRAMIRSADRVLVVADSSKFGQSALVRITGLDEVEAVVTDDGLPEDVVQTYSCRLIRVDVAESLGAKQSADHETAYPGRTLDGADRTSLEPALVPVGVRSATPSDPTG
jgi:DeoR/GlpR family transcriptional regulator of sugar metabolism